MNREPVRRLPTREIAEPLEISEVYLGRLVQAESATLPPRSAAGSASRQGEFMFEKVLSLVLLILLANVGRTDLASASSK